MSAATARTIVLAKAPVAGRVKTRLTPPFTPQQAARLAEAALVDTLHAAEGAGPVVLVLDGEPGTWLPEGIPVLPQRGDGLGERIAAAFADVEAAYGGPVLLVGMDTPQLQAGLLRDAAAALHGADAVFGPAEDGGWWLLGLHRPVPGICDGIAMSRADTGHQQRQRLVAAGLRVVDAPQLLDVDDAASADAVAALAPASRFARTLAELTGRPASGRTPAHAAS